VGCCLAAMQAIGVHRIGLLTNRQYQRSVADYISNAAIDTIATAEFPSQYDATEMPLSVPYRAAVALHRANADIDRIGIPIAASPGRGRAKARWPGSKAAEMPPPPWWGRDSERGKTLQQWLR